MPAYNAAATIAGSIESVLAQTHPRFELLVVDDGSTDGTSDLVRARTDIELVCHSRNRGYGAALRTAFDFALRRHYDVLVTIDCDGQHEPQRIPSFVEATAQASVVSGSRYLQQFAGDSAPPEQRRRINQQVTAELNRRLGLTLTDAFCGFKAYRADALRHLNVSEEGYAMPLEVWVQIARARLSVIELPVPLIYLDEKRSFGGVLDDADTRLNYYHLVLDRSLAPHDALPAPHDSLPAPHIACDQRCGEIAG
jgi:dolichol-phosphate mannosyltransferase